MFSFSLSSEDAYATMSFDALISPGVVGEVTDPTPKAPGILTVVPSSLAW